MDTFSMAIINPDFLRRKWLLALGSAAMPQIACSQRAGDTPKTNMPTPTPTQPIHASADELKRRFRGIGGGELCIDATEPMNIALYGDHFFESGIYSQTKRGRLSYGGSGKGDFS